MRVPPLLPLTLVVLSALALPAAAQGDRPSAGPAGQPGKDDDEVLKAGRRDPYTEGDAVAMQAAGIVAYGPFPWADRQSTADVDRVLGEGRILWLETAHFRIGCSLASAPMPVDAEPRRQLGDELARLHKALPKASEKPKRLDPWLRLHLYAQRAEELYAAFERLVGATDASFGDGQEPPNGRYLGLPGKYLLLLLQKKGDFARYLDRFTTAKSEQSIRYYHAVTNQFLFAVAVDANDSFDEPALHSNVVYSLVQNLACGLHGYTFAPPPWLTEGLAHWYSRQIATEFINCKPKDADAVNDRDKHLWAHKVRLRCQHDGATLSFEQLLRWRAADELGYQGHIQAWSRIDYLMSLGPEKVGLLLDRIKRMPVPPDGKGIPPETLISAQTGALADLCQMDPAMFDQRWREWTQKAYARR
jgi:hypothetical protein